MSLSAVWSNYLWIPKKLVKGTPSEFAPEWEYHVELLKTPEGKIAQQQIAYLREMAEADGEDPDSVAAELTKDDTLEILNWEDMGNWWALCAGDVRKVEALIKRLNLPVKDRRVSNPFDFKALGLKMLMPPRPNQVGAIQKWREAGYGILKAAPAFGKTFVFIYDTIEDCQYTLVLVHTDALAEQFITRFRHGSLNDDGTYTPITNCLEVEAEHGIELVGRYSNPNKLYPVTVATYQSFTTGLNATEALEKVAKFFGRVVVDEVHTFAARSPSSVLNALHAKIKKGVSATPTRKDQLDVALADFIGPVTAVGDAHQLDFDSYIISTGCTYPASRYVRKSEWSKIINWLMKQEDRNDLIVDWLKHDVSSGRRILVLTDRVGWCFEMAERMTRMGIPSRAVVGGMGSKKGMAERESTIKAMMDGSISIIFATSVFKAGVDIPALDTLYYVVPQNNVEQLQQSLGRMRRHYADKQKPLFRYFADQGHGLLIGCARGTQNALVKEKSTIVFVPEGTKPENVKAGKVTITYDDEDKPKKRKGLAAAKNASREALEDIFGDLKKEEKQTRRYNKALGRV